MLSVAIPGRWGFMVVFREEKAPARAGQSRTPTSPLTLTSRATGPIVFTAALSWRWARLLVRLIEPRRVLLVGDIGHVDPGVRHFVDRAIAPAHPLVRIRVVPVRRRVVVPRLDVD